MIGENNKSGALRRLCFIKFFAKLAKNKKAIAYLWRVIGDRVEILARGQSYVSP